METTVTRLSVPEAVDTSLLCGTNDELLRGIEQLFGGEVTVRGDSISICGAPAEVQALTALFSDMIRLVQEGERPDADYIKRTSDLVREGSLAPRQLRDDVLLTHRGRAIRPKTAGQKRYVDAIRTHTLTFGIGVAGTGKTYLAMACAVAALRRREVGRIVLTRPVVEAGENLGFLPGTLEEKVDPYIRPLYDALYDMAEPERVRDLIERGTIEIAPLAFMRGRTFDDAFVILDEAQNATSEQMKMFLTRLGFGSRFVVTGDPTQTDLPGATSAIPGVRAILEGVEDIAFVDLGGTDVVRHSLVGRIIEAYEKYAAQRQQG